MEYRPRTPREGINVSAGHPLSELAKLLVGISFAVVVFMVAVFVVIEVVILRSHALQKLLDLVFAKLRTKIRTVL